MPSERVSDREECMAEGCEDQPVEVHIPVDENGAEYGPHALCEFHSRQTKNKVRDLDTDNEQPRREMGLHEAECDGLDDPRERFNIGDRVEYSDFGRERLDRDQRQGEVVGFGRTSAGHGHCVRVLWDGRKTPSRLAHAFIRLAGGSDR